jgi:hypothetical protein
MVVVVVVVANEGGDNSEHIVQTYTKALPSISCTSLIWCSPGA